MVVTLILSIIGFVFQVAFPEFPDQAEIGDFPIAMLGSLF